MLFGHSKLCTAPSPWRDELRATVTLALPLIATQLAQISMVTTDVVLLGWLGPEALAAGSLGANIFFVLGTFSLGVLMAVSPMVAQAVGRRLHYVRDVRRSVRQGLWATLAVGIPGMVVLWHAEDVLLTLGQDPANAAAARDYARALMWGVIPAAGFMLLRFFVTALERPRPALVVMVMTFAVNATLAYGLIFGKLGLPAFGLVGAGIATSVANTLSFVSLLGFVLLDRRLRRFHILGNFWRPDWRRFVELFRVGLPIGVILLLEVGLFSSAIYLMGILGTAELAAHQIALQIASVSFMVPLGIGQAATVRVGLAAGAGDAAGIARAGWIALMLGVAFMATMATVMWTAPRFLVGLFLDLARPENARPAELAVSFLALAALFQVFDGAQTIAIGALRGLKDTRVPALLAGFGYWLVGFPVGVGLGFGLGWAGIGIWTGLATGLAVVAALEVWRFAWRERFGLVRRAR
ncbi:MAG TPA: MATE family efflux transporter [Alphaproteobacteria bacterium]